MNGTLAKSFRSSSRPVVDVLNPFSGASVGKVEVADEVAVADALRAARKAWRSFRFSTPAERKGLLHRLAELLAEDAEEMAQIICAEVGKTITEARNEVRRAQNTLRLSGDAITVLHGEVLPTAIVAGAPSKRKRDAAPLVRFMSCLWQHPPIGETEDRNGSRRANERPIGRRDTWLRRAA